MGLATNARWARPTDATHRRQNSLTPSLPRSWSSCRTATASSSGSRQPAEGLALRLSARRQAEERRLWPLPCRVPSGGSREEDGRTTGACGGTGSRCREAGAEGSAGHGERQHIRDRRGELLAKKKREGKASATIGKREWLYSLAGDRIGSRPVNEITPPEILTILQDAESKGMLETARRLRSSVGEVFRFAIATGRATSDPTRDLRGAVAAPKVKHRSAIVVAEGFRRPLAGDFRIHRTEGDTLRPPAHGLPVPPPGELRAAFVVRVRYRRRDVDDPCRADEDEARASRPPAPSGARGAGGLASVHRTRGACLSGLQSPRKPTERKHFDNSALRRLGYGPERSTSPHASEPSARSIIDEAGVCGPHIIEAALGHQKKDAVERAYARANLPRGRERSSWLGGPIIATRSATAPKVIPLRA